VREEVTRKVVARPGLNGRLGSAMPAAELELAVTFARMCGFLFEAAPNPDYRMRRIARTNAVFRCHALSVSFRNAASERKRYGKTREAQSSVRNIARSLLRQFYGRGPSSCDYAARSGTATSGLDDNRTSAVGIRSVLPGLIFGCSVLVSRWWLAGRVCPAALVLNIILRRRILTESNSELVTMIRSWTAGGGRFPICVVLELRSGGPELGSVEKTLADGGRGGPLFLDHWSASKKLRRSWGP